MKLALATLILAFGIGCGWTQEKYYVQLIKATNKPDPPTKTARAVGTRIGEQLSPMRWKHYWEIERRDATISSGKAKKIDLAGDRAIEVVPTAKGKVEVRLYREKDIVRKSCHKADSKMMAIFGGDEGERAWFVVVRREEPQYEVAKK